MPLYTSTGSLNVVTDDTTKGRYSPTGALRINLVSGTSYTGLYAADGALNVVDVSGVSISTYGGLYHPCGALRGRTAPDTYSGLQAPDGSYYLYGLSQPFTPAELFANGEQGVWYDPSDMTTLFQDAAGTTPVTAMEQPVGLVLDKSKGLVLGSELVTNGTFDTNTASWTVVSAFATFVSTGGQGVLTVNSGSFFAGQSVTVASGKWYEVRARFVTKSAAGTAFFRADPSSIGGTGYFTVSPSVDGTDLVYRVLTTSTTLYVALGINGSGYSSTWDNISVRELPGNHCSQSTAAARPVLSARVNTLVQTEDFSNAAWTKDSLLAFGSGSTVNATAAPNGTTTADLITSASATTQTGVGQSVAFAAAAYTWTVSVKPNGARYVQLLWGGSASSNYANFDLQSGIVTAGTYTAATITSEANGFFRIAITSALSAASSAAFLWFVDSGTAARAAAFTGDGVKGIYIWGADLRPANAGVGLPAYQRVGAATAGSSTAAGNADYDTTGFPLYLRADGTDDRLIGPAISNLISASAYEACIGARVLAVSTSSASPWLNQSLMADASGYVGVGYMTTSNIIGAFNFDGTSDTATQSMAPPSTFVLQQRHDGGNLVLSLNGGSEASVASGDTSNLTAETRIFSSNGSNSVQAHLYGLVIRSTAFTATERANLRTWMNGKTLAYDPTPPSLAILDRFNDSILDRFNAIIETRV